MSSQGRGNLSWQIPGRVGEMDQGAEKPSPAAFNSHQAFGSSKLCLAGAMGEGIWLGRFQGRVGEMASFGQGAVMACLVSPGNCLPDEIVKELAGIPEEMTIPLRSRSIPAALTNNVAEQNHSCHDYPWVLFDLMIGIQGSLHPLRRLFHIIDRMLYLRLCLYDRAAYPVFQQLQLFGHFLSGL